MIAGHLTLLQSTYSTYTRRVSWKAIQRDRLPYGIDDKIVAGFSFSWHRLTMAHVVVIISRLI